MTTDFSTHTQRTIQSAAAMFLVLAVALGAYCFMAGMGAAPAFEWSPIGQSQQVQDAPVKFELPEGWEPAVPSEQAATVPDGSVNA